MSAHGRPDSGARSAGQGGDLFRERTCARRQLRGRHTGIASLEARVASFLAAMAKDSQSRLQILATTHSDLVVQYADQAVLLKRDGAQTVLPA